MTIVINIEKAKKIAHDIRRVARQNEFAPLDEVIAKKIPGVNFEEVEKQRETIRQKYAEMQEKIDLATTIESLKSLLPSNA